jgi:hypothetical protein
VVSSGNILTVDEIRLSASVNIDKIRDSLTDGIFFGGFQSIPYFIR